MRPGLTLTAAVLAAAVLAGCGGDTPADLATAGGSTADGAASPTASPEPADETTEETTVPADVPSIDVPGGEPPTQLQTTDVIEGTGEVAESGDHVFVDYVGALYESPDQPFDLSYGRAPIDFVLGSPGLIAGFSEGVAGMKVGGRRQVVIPPDAGYGAQGRPPVIPGNATLVFVLDLREVQKG